MKKLAICSIILIAAVACKKEVSNELPTNTRAFNSAEQLGKGVISALQQHSEERYLETGLSSDDFQTFMEMEAVLYKINPEAYKKETEQNYKSYFLPELQKSFEAINQQSRKLNINWEAAEFKGVEIMEDVNTENKVTIVPMEIHFSYQDKDCVILIEKAIVIEGKWTISQFTELKNK